MKKIFLVFCALIIAFSFSSCAKKETREYKVGDIGPAGGYVFYDKGYYSDGWRYLEAAPADLSVVAGKPSVDKSDSQYDSGDKIIIFGYYRKSAYGKNLYVNGKEDYASDCTGIAVGTGKKNTKLLVKAMRSSAYSESSGSDITASYAAKLCSDLVYNGFDDWFLPSKGELNLIYVNLRKAGLGDFANFSNYWSSSEISSNVNNVWGQYFGSGDYSGDQDSDSRHFHDRVRPVRAF